MQLALAIYIPVPNLSKLNVCVFLGVFVIMHFCDTVCACARACIHKGDSGARQMSILICRLGRRNGVSTVLRKQRPASVGRGHGDQ